MKIVRIVSFADDIGKAKNRLSRNAEYLIEHLTKLFYYSDTVSFDEWYKTIWNCCNKLEVKRRYNNLSKSIVLDLLWYNSDSRILEKHNSTFDMMLKTYKRVGVRCAEPEIFLMFAKDYIFWLAEKLTTVGKITQEECLLKIEGLLYLYGRVDD